MNGQQLKHSGHNVVERPYDTDTVVNMANDGSLSYEFGNGVGGKGVNEGVQSLETKETKGNSPVSLEFTMSTEGGVEKSRRID